MVQDDARSCKWWLKGNCKFGKDCRFSHEGEPVVNNKVVGSPSMNMTPDIGNPRTKAPLPEIYITKTPATRTPEEKKARRQLFRNRRFFQNTKTLMKSFTVSEIGESTNTLEINDSKFVASYNWSNADEPVIFVPGCPARWNPPSLPYQVPKDNGQAFIDQNNHRSPSASFDPFFKALLTMHPNFDMVPIDLVTDRNSLRKLLRFVSGKVPQDWRIDVDIVEDTMFFTRWEENQIQIITGAKESGYGREFEKAFLTYDSDPRQSSGHHRIIRYNIGGIECLVRFEVDGCLDSMDNGKQTFNENPDAQTSSFDKISEVLSGLDIKDSKKASISTSRAEVRVIERGRLVDNSTVLELKSTSKSARMQEAIPQLWISQTYHLIIGRHKDGLVNEKPEEIHMSKHFSAWECTNETCLRKLITLISEIKKVTKGAKRGQCALICKKNEAPKALHVYKRDGKPFFLPEDTKEKCWGRNNEKGGVLI